MAWYHFVLALSVVSSTNAALTTTGCGTTKTCIRGRAGCSGSSDCDTLIMFQVNMAQKTVRVEFSIKEANVKFVAVGVNPNGARMMDTVGVLCTQANSSAFDYWVVVAPDRVAPNWDQYRMMNNVSSVSVMQANGVFECSFTRALNMTSPQNNWLGVPYHVAMTYGTSLASNNYPVKHTKAYISSSKYTFTTANTDIVLSFRSAGSALGVGSCLLMTLVAFTVSIVM